MLLVVGTKNYTSWSLRPWLAMKVLGIPFRELRVPLYGPASKAEILKHSPAGKVPILADGETHVWDSLAILEYLAEQHPGVWPADAKLRARALRLGGDAFRFPEPAPAHVHEHPQATSRQGAHARSSGRDPAHRRDLERVPRALGR